MGAGEECVGPSFWSGEGRHQQLGIPDPIQVNMRPAQELLPLTQRGQHSPNVEIVSSESTKGSSQKENPLLLPLQAAFKLSCSYGHMLQGDGGQERLGLLSPLEVVDNNGRNSNTGFLSGTIANAFGTSYKTKGRMQMVFWFVKISEGSPLK